MRQSGRLATKTSLPSAGFSPLAQAARAQRPAPVLSSLSSTCLSALQPSRAPYAAARHIASMSMPGTSGHGRACCNIPPVVAEGYVAKGSYEQLGGSKTYVTGPADATLGIVSIFDIFGFVDQTVQGADILSAGIQGAQYKVFIPDWFDGNSCPTEWYPPDTPEKQNNLGAWFSANDPNAVAAKLPAFVDSLKAAYPSITKWGLIGYCWGGKVAELVTSAPSNPFAVAAGLHPAMIDPEGAKSISVPYLLLASGEDPAADVAAFEQGLSVPHHVETFGDQVHGWMAARADLSDPRVREEYARGYQTVLEFFGRHL